MRIRVMLALALVAVLALTGCVKAAPAADWVQPLLLEKVRQSPGELVTAIVQGRDGALEPLAAAVQARGGQVTKRWEFINALAAQLPARAVPGLAQTPGIKYISWDAPVHGQWTGAWNNTGGGGTTPPYSVNTANVKTFFPFAVYADKVWSTGNYGAGTTVAVLDSGLTPNGSGSGDFGSRSTSNVVNVKVTGSQDNYGHGTWVAGIIGGDGTVSGQGYVGVAPQARLVSVKVSDDTGVATIGDLIDGLNWIYSNAARYSIRVINISMQSSVQMSYLDDPLDAAVEQVWGAGIVVVVSAGNNGGRPCSVCYAPANDPYVITVGAVDDMGTVDQQDDTLTTWSSFGVTQDGFRKPDLFAPGAHIVGALSGYNQSRPTLALLYPGNIMPTGYYIKMGGTSAAAPIAAGAVALMLTANPTWTPDQVKWVLTQTAGTFNSQPSGYGGVLRADAAVAYSMAPSAANGGLVPSSGTRSLGSSGSTAQWSTAQWSTSGDF